MTVEIKISIRFPQSAV